MRTESITQMNSSISIYFDEGKSYVQWIWRVIDIRSWLNFDSDAVREIALEQTRITTRKETSRNMPYQHIFIAKSKTWPFLVFAMRTTRVPPRFLRWDESCAICFAFILFPVLIQWTRNTINNTKRIYRICDASECLFFYVLWGTFIESRLHFGFHQCLLWHSMPARFCLHRSAFRWKFEAENTGEETNNCLRTFFLYFDLILFGDVIFFFYCQDILILHWIQFHLNSIRNDSFILVRSTERERQSETRSKR